jgi:hypothetical protein
MALLAARAPYRADPGVAGGSGLAPVKSIVETALAAGMAQPIALYLASRRTRPYLEDHFPPSPRATPTELRPGASGFLNSAGAAARLRHAAALAIRAFDGAKAYRRAGWSRRRRGCPERGARRGDIHADAFYTEAGRACRAAENDDMTPLGGRTALVTGGARGVSHAIVCARFGASVVADHGTGIDGDGADPASRARSPGSSAPAPPPHRASPARLRGGPIDLMVRRFGDLDIVVNNAAILRRLHLQGGPARLGRGAAQQSTAAFDILGGG